MKSEIDVKIDCGEFIATIETLSDQVRKLREQPSIQKAEECAEYIRNILSGMDRVLARDAKLALYSVEEYLMAYAKWENEMVYKFTEQLPVTIAGVTLNDLSIDEEKGILIAGSIERIE
jgi:hypothetical protein